MPSIQEIYEKLCLWAPPETQMDFDNSGFLLGHGERAVTRVLLSLDITAPVIEEAADWGAELIVSHHPLIFHPLRSLHETGEGGRALRLAGFKIQIHFMANLLGSTPEADKQDYLRLVSDPRFLPDEVKLYPCCLVESSRLMQLYHSGAWQPYAEDELIDLLVADTLATPAYTRISRMIRDISTTDIVAGNKKTNLRQMVEARIVEAGAQAKEIRMREIATSEVNPTDLRMDCVSYHTTVSREHFLQWITSDRRIAGFLRLSLPIEGDEAMIREVHVYGRVASLGSAAQGGAQHAGLGRQLVERACQMAQDAGYATINVISSVGTRNYYRSLGFTDGELYQHKPLS